MKYTIEEIFKKVKESTKQFKSNLASRKLLIIYEENGEIKKTECFFPSSSFYHLTGVEAFDNKRQPYKSFKFYEDMLNGTINIRNISKRKDGTTDLKIEVLPQLLNLDRTAKMTGIFSGSNISLETEQLIGGIKACVGFKYIEKYNSFIPNTLLKEDIRQISSNRGTIICILKRHEKDKFYKNITYIKKEYELNEIFKNEEIFKEIDFSKINSIDKVINNKINTYKQQKP